MRKLTYFAIFEPSGTGYSVYFPDLPGCVSYGDDLDTAQKAATEALGLHIYGLEKDGESVPVPSPVPEVDPDTAKGYIAMPVVVFPDIVKNDIDNRRVKTNVTIPAWLKDIAEDANVNLSRVFEAALIDYLNVKR